MQPDETKQSQNPKPTNDHAANVVRGQVNDAYDQHGDPNNPYDRTHNDEFDWSKYHSAWQDYYQKYYEQYYQHHLNAMREQQAAQTPVAADATPAQAYQAKSEPQEDDIKSRVAQVKKDLLLSVKEHAKKARKSHHFVPIMAAVMVAVVFLFIQFNSVFIAYAKAYISPGKLSGDSIVIDPNQSANVSPEPRLIIPKINVDVPVNYNVNTLEESKIQDGLRDGTVHYKLPGANSVPGQYGNSVILGHSGNDVFNSGEYKFVFVLLDKMETGDVFYAHYKGKRYTYKITKKQVINPDQVRVLQTGYDKPMMTLITCTPPGTALKRLLLYADQISPDPSASSKAPANQTPANKEDMLPGIEKNLFEQIFDAIF